MTDHFRNILILAFPASGKSEILTFLRGLTDEQRAGLHIGKLVELDDFPCVDFMFKIDDARERQGRQRFLTVHQDTEEGGFVDGSTWDTLDAHLANIYDRTLLASPRIHENSTIMLECARGGPENARFPLEHGYERTLANLPIELLGKAVVLYINVTPETSRRKNEERYNPNDPSSILSHMVPRQVMRRDYGCDDIGYLMEKAKTERHEGYIQSPSGLWVPFAFFDNNVDKTSFVRTKNMSPEDKKVAEDNLYNALKIVLDPLHERMLKDSRNV